VCLQPAKAASQGQLKEVASTYPTQAAQGFHSVSKIVLQSLNSKAGQVSSWQEVLLQVAHRHLGEDARRHQAISR